MSLSNSKESLRIMIKQDIVWCSNETETAEMGFENVRKYLTNVY